MQLPQGLDFLSVYFGHDHPSEAGHSCGETIVFNSSQDNNVFHFLKESARDIVSKDLAEAAIIELKGGKEVNI